MSDEETGESEDAYGLVMPFVVCESNGGPLGDLAFTVGYELGGLAAELHACSNLLSGLPAVPAPRYLHAVGAAQIDLIAMRYGFSIETEPWQEGEEWIRVTFSRAET